MRRSVPVSLFLSLATLVFLTGCTKLRARDELNKGVRAYKAADYDRAIQHFKRSIELDPELLNSRLYLATAYASQFVPGAPSEENKQLGEAAIQEFTNVLERDPGNVNSLAYIAQIYFGMAGTANEDAARMELFAKSKEFRRRLIEVQPDNPEHYYSIGVIDWALTYKPRMQVKADLKLRPDQPLPRRARRQLAEQNTELVEEGIDVLQKALEINPTYLDALAYLNLMYREKADIVDSAEEREQYLQQADDLVDRHKQLRDQKGAATATTAN
ncbi:MAG: tetratricopeptide repeat protein [Terriglobia bacterium]